jgi:hypothetical protein
VATRVALNERRYFGSAKLREIQSIAPPRPQQCRAVFHDVFDDYCRSRKDQQISRMCRITLTG